MIRQNLTAGSPYADVMVHGDGLIALQYREVQDGPTRQIIAATEAASAPGAARARGRLSSISRSPGADGRLAHAGGNYRIALGPEYHVGLAVSAHNDALTETATFANVDAGGAASSPMCRTPAIRRGSNRRSR